MRIYRFQGEKVLEAEASSLEGDDERVVIASTGELEAYETRLGLKGPWRRFVQSDKPSTRVDGYGDALFLSLNVMEEPGPLVAFWSPGQLVLSCPEGTKLLERLEQLLASGEGQPMPLSGALRGLYLLLSLATYHNQSLLERTEEKITALEARVLRHDRSINGQNFIVLRRRLLGLKRHGQPLEEICDLLYENESGLLPDEAARAMATLYRRNGRTNAEIANLENYVAQVREAYQNHLDLRMNRSMMALTVLAAIFLPLSLIVGWYGMNFPMPEFSWRWGYGYVIALSLVCLGGSIWYFKRKGLI